MKLESWAATAAAQTKSSEPATATLRPMAGSPDSMLEAIPDRRLEPPRQNGPGEEQVARRAALQPRIAFLQPLRLEHVQHVGRERDALPGQGVGRTHVQVGVRGQDVPFAGRIRRVVVAPRDEMHIARQRYA